MKQKGERTWGPRYGLEVPDVLLLDVDDQLERNEGPFCNTPVKTLAAILGWWQQWAVAVLAEESPLIVCALAGLRTSFYQWLPWQTMAKFAPHMGDPHGDPQTSPQHADPHGLGAFLSKPYKKSMWIGVSWAGLRVAMWITHFGGEFRHGLLEKSLILGASNWQVILVRNIWVFPGYLPKFLTYMTLMPVTVPPRKITRPKLIFWIN